jgi:ribosomal protein S18 acetylase RimI-like enzyme
VAKAIRCAAFEGEGAQVTMPVNGGVEFRAARFAELPELAEFWLAMFEEIGQNPRRDFCTDWREGFARYFERRVAADEAAYFVAQDGAKLVGAAAGILSDGYPSEIHGISYGYVLGVYVLPEYRAQGIATKLTDLTIDFFRRRNVASIRLHASPFGRSIYARLGFVETNEMKLDLSAASPIRACR